MAKYNISGVGESLFNAFGADSVIKGNLLYVNAVQFGIRNADGSTTHVYGKQFSYDAATGEFTGGVISSIRHFDPEGRYIDDITGLQVSTQDFQSALEGGTLGALLLEGDDMLVAVYLRSNPGNVDLNGYDGDDSIFGNWSNNQLLGGDGNDIISGRRGADRLDGGNGDDMLHGGNGRDWIAGGNEGDDLLRGGRGADTFFFTFSADEIRPVGAEWGNDIISDFHVGIDRLILSDMLSRPMTYGNDADGNAVIRIDADNSVTLIGIDATKVSLDDLLV